jgi:hypothetical protein
MSGKAIVKSNFKSLTRSKSFGGHEKTVTGEGDLPVTVKSPMVGDEPYVPFLKRGLENPASTMTTSAPMALATQLGQLEDTLVPGSCLTTKKDPLSEVTIVTSADTTIQMVQNSTDI